METSLGSIQKGYKSSLCKDPAFLLASKQAVAKAPTQKEVMGLKGIHMAC